MTLDIALDVLSWIALVGGGVFCVISAIGVWRMPDPYTRLHAASVTDTLGAGLIVVGLMLQSGLSLITLKLGIILLLTFFISPVVGHAVSRAMLQRDVKPVLAEDLEERR